MAKHRLQPQPNRGATAARGALAAGAVTIGTLAAPAATVLAAPAPNTATTAPAQKAANTAPTAKPKTTPPAKPKTATPAAKKAPVAKKSAAARPNVVTGFNVAPKPGTTSVAGVQPGGVKAKAVQAALSRRGMPYSYGAAGPNAFDCSGLIYWSMRQAGISVPRDSWGQLGGGTPVSIKNLQPGDIVIYNGGSHAALYIGDGKVVHSVNYGIPVKVSPLNEMSFYSARRY